MSFTVVQLYANSTITEYPYKHTSKVIINDSDQKTSGMNFADETKLAVYEKTKFEFQHIQQRLGKNHWVVVASVANEIQRW